MTSKERVKAALAHRQPDRVPMGENEIDAPIIEAVLGHSTYYTGKFRLMQAYWEGRRDEAVDSMKRDYVEFLRKTEHDIAKIMLVPDKDAEFYPLKQTSANDYEDENGNAFRYSEQTHELIHMKAGKGPVKLVSSRQQPGKPYEPSESELEFARYVIEDLGDTHFIIAPAYVGPPGMPHRGTSYFDAMLQAIIERPEQYRDQRVRGAEGIARSAEYYKALGCDAVMGGEDLGHNKGTLMSPTCFRGFLFPGIKAQAHHAHSKGMPYFFHSCGNNRAIWQYFAEAGLDAYQAIQDEEPMEDLKREIGSKVTLWGGVSCRWLDNGTAEQIREQTRRSIEVAAHDGGFILGSSHSLGVGVKYDNYMAMLETWHRYR
ncbi:MAG: uroporphyrinogen decarboxylase family protein [Planctomycetota bacterium]